MPQHSCGRCTAVAKLRMLLHCWCVKWLSCCLRSRFPRLASAGNETVKAPGNLVVSAYVTCPDVTKVRGQGSCWSMSCCTVQRHSRPHA